MKSKTCALFIFRRDLRCDDNTGLLFALENYETVIPCFIFTPEQTKTNPYKSGRCLQFMLESLKDLADQLKERSGKLYCFYGHPETIISKLKIDAVIVNRDYTPFSTERDKALKRVCNQKQLAFHSFDDALLHAPQEVLKKDGKPYLVFTPFYRKALSLPVLKPKANRYTNYFQGKLALAQELAVLQKKIIFHPSTDSELKGGRKEALNKMKQRFAHYLKDRDDPAKDATTHFSPYLKFTVVSPREVYQAFKNNTHLIRSLVWRDFFTSIAFFFPHVFQGSFHQKFNRLAWKKDKSVFQLWQEGSTGFPIVDAGMREMKHTGFMHNRLRMITASFLIKDLHLNWRWGEQFFAQSLIDYDPAVNNGNWQWSASTGCDAQPYFRIFNPWAQQKKFDPDCLYIKRWVPELEQLDPKIIHGWYEKKHHSSCPSYPAPCVDHGVEAKEALKRYRAVYRS